MAFSLGSLLGGIEHLAGQALPIAGLAADLVPGGQVFGIADNVLGPALMAGGALANAAGQNNALQGQSNAYTQLATQNAARQAQAYDALMNAVNQQASAGAFSPDQAINNLQHDIGYWQKQAMGSAAAALQNLGYRQGDSQIGNVLGNIGAKYQQMYADQAQQARNSAQQAQLNALSMLSGQGGTLNAGTQLYSGLANQAYGRQQNPTGLLTSMMPYLGQYSSAMTGQNGAAPKIPSVPSATPDPLAPFDLVSVANQSLVPQGFLP